MASAAVMGLLRMLGVRGTLVVVAVVGGVYLFAPSGLKQAIVGALSGDPSGGRKVGTRAAGSVCTASPAFGRACGADGYRSGIGFAPRDVTSRNFRTAGRRHRMRQ